MRILPLALIMTITCSSPVQSLTQMKIRVVLPGELAATLGEERPASACKLWDLVLPRRLSSISAENGTWLADGGTSGVSCIAQVTSPSRISLFHRGMTSGGDEEENTDDIRQEVILAMLEAAVRELLDADTASREERLVLKFDALGRRLIPYIRTVLSEGHVANRKFSSIYTSQCGMWTCEAGKQQERFDSDFNKDLPEGIAIRPLSQSDAKLVNDRWEYKSDTSLDMVRQMIQHSEEKHGGCIGLFVDDKLVSWVCRYLDGTLGMLFTESDSRKRGYAGLVLATAVSDIRRRTQMRYAEGELLSEIGSADDDVMVSYIVETNDASKNLYRKLGWKRVADAAWIGFASRKEKT